MSKPIAGFLEIASQINRVNAQREQLIRQAFDALDRHHSDLAQLVQNYVGTRQRAAIWMASHQRTLGGRTAHKALAEDDMECIWDLVDVSDEDTRGKGERTSQLAH